MALSIQERLGLSTEPISGAMWQWLCKLRCAIPATVISFDPVTQTCLVQPVIQEVVLKPPPGKNPLPGTTQNIPTPETIDPIQNVPIVMMRVPGWSMTFPIVQGTECLLIFSDMCIDGWWQSGGVQPNFDSRRRHNLSDAIAIFGPWSQPNVLTNYSTDSIQIRSDDQTVVIDLKTGQITITAPAVLVQNTGTPLALVNDTFYQWFITNIMPFLVSKGYSGPPVPLGSETTVLKAE